MENIKTAMPAGHRVAFGKFLGAAKHVLKIARRKHGDAICQIRFKLIQRGLRFRWRHAFARIGGVPETTDAVLAICKHLHAARNEQFGNARAMRNLFESAVRNQSSRLVSSGQCARDALTTLLPEDLPADFATGMPAPPETKPTTSRIAPRAG